MKLGKFLIMAAMAILTAFLFCLPASAEYYLVCEDKDEVCPKCQRKRKIECWGAMPIGPPSEAIYECGKISVKARSGGSESLYCYPFACWQDYTHYWPLYQNMCGTMYKECCERTKSGKCSVFYKHPLTGNEYGYPQGFRPPSQ